MFRHRAGAAALLVACAAWSARAADELGDPTQPTPLAVKLPAVAAAAAPAGPRWHLWSTLVSEGRRVAVINGRTLKRGDRIDDATLVEIFNDRVTLDYDGRRMTVHLLPATLKVKRGS